MHTKTICKQGVPICNYFGPIPVYKQGVPVCIRGLPICIQGCLFYKASLLNESHISERPSRHFWCSHLCICARLHTHRHNHYTHKSGNRPFACISAHLCIGCWCDVQCTSQHQTILQFLLHNTMRYCNPIPDIAIPICIWGLHLSLSSPFKYGDQLQLSTLVLWHKFWSK
jgi:hypothetical protein